MRRTWLSILSLIPFFTQILAAQTDFDLFPVLDVDRGLAQNSILQMAQDRYGYVWVGTQSGLSRWDGAEVVNYPGDESDALPSGYVEQILKDHLGQLWVIPSDGILYRRQEKEKRFAATSINTHDYGDRVAHMAEDPLNGGLILCFDDGSIQFWSFGADSLVEIDRLDKKEAVSTHVWLEDDLLLGTKGGWVFLEKGRSRRPSPVPWEGPVYDSLLLGDKLIFAAGEAGVRSWSPGEGNVSLIHKHTAAFLGQVGESSILSSSNESAVFRSIDRGGEWSTQTLGIPSSIRISQLLVLRTGQIIMGTTAAGLWMNDPYDPSFGTWSPRSNEETGDIMTYAEEGPVLWLGTYDGGFYRYEREADEYKSYNTELGNTPSDRIKYLMKDSRGDLWAATYDKGLLLYDRKQDRFFIPDMGEEFRTLFDTVKVNHIYENENGLLWLSTGEGLFSYDRDRRETVWLNEALRLPPGNMWTVWKEEDKFWLGCDEGLYALNAAGVLEKIKTENSRIWFVWSNGEGLVFAASPSGLEIFDSEGNPLYFFNLYKSLENLSVYGVVWDSKGKYWITTNKGVYYWAKEEERVEHFSHANGLLSNELNLYSLGEWENGRIFLGGIKGFNTVDPEKLQINPHTSRIILSSLEVIGGEKPDNKTEPELPDFSHSDAAKWEILTLGPNDKILNIGFDIIDFHKSRGTRMEYMLHGLSDEWIDITGQRGLTFANLPPGDYILRVKTILDNNIENTTRLLDIHVRPAFHQTLWFIILLATILTGILVVITSYISKLRHEIGQRKSAENELRKLHMYMERILDSMPSALIGINEEGKIDLWNRRARDDYSIPREKAKGRLAWDVLKELVFLKGEIGPIIERGSAVEFDRLEFPKGQENVYWDITVFPVLTERGVVIRIDDVTHQEEMERKIIRTEKLTSIGKLAAGMAHDMNNLLTPMMGYAELLQIKHSEEREDAEMLEQIIGAGERAQKLIGQLLSFSKRSPQNERVVFLNEVISSFENLLRRTIRENIVIKMSLTNEKTSLKIDPGQLEQIILNLAVNAQDAMPGGGEMTLETRRFTANSSFCRNMPGAREGDYVMFSLKDEGSGMDKMTQSKIFDPFFSTKGSGGTGLGLSTAYAIVSAQGGFTDVISAPGEGTDIRIYLPFVPDIPPKKKTDSVKDVFSGGNETILIVEDNKNVLLLAENMLATHGYNIITADSGDEALKQADSLIRKKISVDLLLTDVVMPGMDGRKLSKKLNDKFPQAKVIFMSGYTNDLIDLDNEDILKRFIQKPFTLEKLLTRVREALDFP